MAYVRQNARAVTALREIVKCCNEDGGDYIITEPDPDLFIVWQYEDGDDDWSRVWWFENVPGTHVGWSYVDYNRTGRAIVPVDDFCPGWIAGRSAPPCPVAV